MKIVPALYLTMTTILTAAIGLPATAALAQADTNAEMDRETDTRAFVYSRKGKLQPELFVSDRQGKVTIAYEATQSYEEMEQIYRRGAYGITSGVMEEEFNGNVFTGTYYEPERYADLQTSCEDRRNGSLVHGRVILTFSLDWKSYTGKVASCDRDPLESYGDWEGQFLRREAYTYPKGTAGAARTGGGTATAAVAGAASPTGSAPAMDLNNTPMVYDYDSSEGPVRLVITGNRVEGLVGADKRRLDGLLKDGVFIGYWTAPKGKKCAAPRGKAKSWGKVQWTLTVDMAAWEGQFASCDASPSSGDTWIGAIAAPPVPLASINAQAAEEQAAGRREGASVFDRIGSNAAQVAEREVNRKVDEGVNGLIDRIF